MSEAKRLLGGMVIQKRIYEATGRCRSDHKHFVGADTAKSAKALVRAAISECDRLAVRT